ncbi:MAG TPA: hypothetical protein PK385_07445 [Spirochaetota bacterium]|jgi:hypothetical protein|nr:MAG: hypothetical protein BWX91_02554 [Spirochaetes bacterium ADurb.Bin133]HNZ28102.1 hypothetical protein [Spirochaetota bacterium]HOF00782.1 hypothetical protein [Spirochaetota bacterium]HOS32461.1 hypothetical protein [Spirochaetota bacterium]HOS55876.1 hypothetical protein [Spirochaetota bacterium]
MFIGISADLASIDSIKRFEKVLLEYGVKKSQKNLYESYEFPTKRLGNLKKDITDNLDMDDKIRIYQYPLDNCFKISYLEDKKWKRLSINNA